VKNQVNHLLVDGSYLVWRSFLSTPPLHSPKGVPTNALHGFFGSLTSILKSLGNPTCFIAWDSGFSGRENLIPEYKQHRKKSPDALREQAPLIAQLCRLLGWSTFRVPGYEADDIIFSLHLYFDKESKAIFTTDKDMVALVGGNTLLLERRKGKSYLLNAEDITAKWGIRPGQIPDLLAMEGDKIDGIPGIAGLGRKTGIKLLQRYPDLEQIFRAAEAGELGSRETRLISGNREKILLNRQVVQLQQLPLDMDAPKPDLQAAEAIFLELGMVKTAEKLVGAQRSTTTD